MIVELIVGQLLLIIFNVCNAYFDAYRIVENKTIAHGLNFCAYLIFCSFLCFAFDVPIKFWKLFGEPIMPHGATMLFFIIAFFNRQLSFDVPLNIRRGLDWDYQSTAKPPKSITDRIERFIFGEGNNVGKRILAVYLGCYVSLVVSFIIAYG